MFPYDITIQVFSVEFTIYVTATRPDEATVEPNIGD